MRPQDGVAVAGSHGKTTTTSIIAAVPKGSLTRRHRRRAAATWARGLASAKGLHGRRGREPTVVPELTPTVAVVTNIDREHLDTYADLADILEAFLSS